MTAGLPPAPHAGRTRSFPPLRGLLPLGLVLAAWQVAGSERSPYFPPPSTWARGVARLWGDATLQPALGQTLLTFALALAGATVVGCALGFVVGASRRLDRALGPTLEFARAMPPSAVVPIAVLLIGYDQRMKVAVVAFAAVWPVLLNVRSGVRMLDPALIDTARSLHLGRFDRARKVVLPAVAPSILLGVRVSGPVALVVTLLVEILTRAGGLGSLIALGQRNYLAAQVYGLILVAGLFSLLVSGGLAVVEARVLRRRGLM